MKNGKAENLAILATICGIKVSMKILKSAGLRISEFADFCPISEEKSKLLGLSTKTHVPFLVRENAYGNDFAFNLAEVAKKGGKKC